MALAPIWRGAPTRRAAEYATDPETDARGLRLRRPTPSFKGLNLLLTALETMNGQSTLDKHGKLQTQCYINMSRRPGERVSDYSSRFRTAVADLKAEGVMPPHTESLRLAGFSNRSWAWRAFENNFSRRLWRDLSPTARLKLSVCSIRDLHMQDPLYRRAERAGGKLTIRRLFGGGASSGQAPSSTSTSSAYCGSIASRRSSTFSVPSSSGRLASGRFAPRQVHATAAAGDEGDGFEEEADAETGHVNEDQTPGRPDRRGGRSDRG